MKGKTFVRVLVIIAIAVVVICAGAVVTLRLMFPPEKIKALAVPQVEKLLGRQVKVDKAGISIFPFIGASISGVEIANTSRPGFSTEPFVKLNRFLVQVSVMSIFKGYPEIGKVIIDKPQIRLEVDAKGKFNYDDLAMLKADSTKKKEEKKSGPLMLPVPVSMKKFELRDGMVSYVDRKSRQEIVLGDIDNTIKLSLDKTLKNINTSGSLVISGISVKTKEISKPLSNLTFTFTHDIGANLVDGTADVRQIRLSLQKLFLNLKGNVTGLNTEPNLDLAVTTDPVQIKDLLAEIPPELAPVVKQLTADGILELSLMIKGSFKEGRSLPINGKIALKNGTVKYVSLPKSINGINADISFTDNSLNIGSLALNLGANPVNLKGTVINFKKPLIDLALDARVDLTDLKDVIEIPKGSALSGLVAADVKARGKADAADPGKLDLKGSVDLKDLKILWSPLAKPAFIDGAFSLSSKAIGQKLTVKVGESSLNSSATIANYLSMFFGDSTKHLPRTSIDFKMAAPYLNLDDVLLPPDTTTTKAKTETADEGGPMIAPLPGIDMKGTISAGTIIYKGIRMSNMMTIVKVVNDVADVDFKTGFSGGTIANTLHGDLRNVNDVAFTNKLAVQNIEVNDLMLNFGKNVIKPTTALNTELLNIQNSLFGKITLNSTLSGNGGTADEITKSLLGSIAVNMNEGRIVNTPILKSTSSALTAFTKNQKLGLSDAITFRNLSALIKLAHGQAIFEKCNIGSSEGDWDVKGNVGFDTKLAMQIANKLTKETSARLLAAENTVKSFASDKLKGTQLAGMAGLLQGMNVIPRDKDNRVTLKFGLGGTVAKPQISSVAFGEGTTGEVQQQPSVKQQAEQQVKQAIQQKTQELQQKVDEEKARAQAELEKKAAEQKAALEAQKKAQEEQLKKKATERLKKIF